MAIYDRDYIFGRSPARRPALWSVNTWLIAANVLVFAIMIFTTRPGSPSPLTAYGHFSTFRVTREGGLEFWRFLTFQFLHASLPHLFFNMLGLYMFGKMVEQHLGSKRYLAFYLTCGVFGGLAYLLLNAGGVLAAYYNVKVPGLLFNDTRTPLVGASAGVFGVILGCAYIAPNLVVQLLFPPIPMKLRTMAYVYVGIAAATVIFSGRNAGGEAAHLGGAAAGAILIRRAYLLRDFFDVFSDSRKGRSKPEGGRSAVHRPAPPVDDAELDRILAKVRSEGVHSLTEGEKETLRRITNQKRASGAA